MATTRLEHRHLRSALEFAVLIVNEGRKRRPPIPFPPGLKQYLGMQRIPASALGPLRRVIEADDEFRSRLAVGAVPELVDPIGILWLTRPEGWEVEVDALVVAAEQAELDEEHEAAARRERKRREAAEQATARSRAEVLALERQLGELVAELEAVRAELQESNAAMTTLREEVVERRNQVRHANDRATAAARRAEMALADRESADARRSSAEQARDEVLAGRVEATADASQFDELASLAQDLAARLTATAGRLGAAEHDGRTGPPERLRRPLPLPGGVIGDSEAATEHLLRSGASILVDGYNVSMLGWPALDLAAQRRALLDATENLARRFGADVTVVFDGAGITGASGDQRRLIRVVFSPDGVIADDVIRAEVFRLPVDRPVVVVTNDAEIVRDVRAMGANTVSSERFVATARR